MIDLKHVEAFHSIVRLGSFSAAARHLHTTQPAVSARIRALEHELGVKLFSTDSRRALLTPKGAEFVRHAEELLAMVRRISISMSNPTQLPVHIRLGATETIAMTWLESCVEKIRAAFPNVFLEIDVSLAGALWNRYRSGALDIIIVPEPIIDTKVNCTKLGRVECRWVSGPKFEIPRTRLRAAELAGFPLISLSSESALFQLADHWFNENGVTPNWANFCSSMTMVLSLIKLGLGISLLPTGLAGLDLDDAGLRFIDVEPGNFSLSFFTVYDAYAPSPVLAEVARLTAQLSTFEKHD